MKKSLLLAAFLVLGVLGLFAQSNALIDEYLDKSEADYASSAYFILSAAGLVPDSASPGDAVEKARSQWGIEPPEGRESLNLGEFSHLVMQAFGIPGGIMYTLVPGPRYAARELEFRDFILDKPRPGRMLSGEEALSIIGEALTWQEER